MADAATIKPKLIADYLLQGRDDSGGADFDPYTGQWDDGGYVFGGAKSHLSASGGSMPAKEGTERSDDVRTRSARRAQRDAN
jgi:hypothetical protein